MKNYKVLLLDYLKSQNLMAIASRGKDLWIATVYYTVDDDFNLYFISQPDTIHCQQILKNPQVTCAIFDSKQKVTQEKIGVQILGTAAQVHNLEKMKWMLAMWNKANPGFEKIINLKNIKKKVIKSRVFKVQAKRIKFFNEKDFGPEGTREFNCHDFKR